LVEFNIFPKIRKKLKKLLELPSPSFPALGEVEQPNYTLLLMNLIFTVASGIKIRFYGAKTLTVACTY